MRFAGGGASLCATHRCASFPASLCRCSLPLAPLLSSSVANGIDKKKIWTRTITRLRFMNLLRKGSCRRIFRVTWVEFLCVPIWVAHVSAACTDVVFDIIDLLHKHPLSKVVQLDHLVLISWMRFGTCHCWPLNEGSSWASLGGSCCYSTCAILLWKVMSILRELTLTSTTRSRWYEARVKKLRDLAEALLYKVVNRERLGSFANNYVQLCVE